MEQLVGDESMNVEEIRCGSVAAVSGPNVVSEGAVGTEEVHQSRTTSVCPGLTHSSNPDTSDFEVSSHEREEMDKIL